MSSSIVGRQFNTPKFVKNRKELLELALAENFIFKPDVYGVTVIYESRNARVVDFTARGILQDGSKQSYYVIFPSINDNDVYEKGRARIRETRDRYQRWTEWVTKKVKAIQEASDDTVNER